MGWYFTILQEMREMGLKGNELIAFAVINGFSQNGQGCFHGSLASLQEMCGIASRQTMIDVLKSLIEKGLISKTENIQNGVKNVSYSVCPKNGQGVQKMDKGCLKNGHNINNDINNTPTEYINKDKDVRFDFKKSLLEIGVSPQVAEDWLKVRKAKKAANTKTAFERIHTEIMLSGMSADECIRIAVERSWQGFKAEWVDNYRRQQPARPTGRRGVSVLENNRNVAEELLRMSMNMEETS
jgi:hypothetical protein